MAELTIRLVSNPSTGKRDIYIDYESEDDALPFEHEQDHRDILEQLLGQGILDEEDVGNVKVARVKPEANKTGKVEERPEREAQSEST